MLRMPCQSNPGGSDRFQEIYSPPWLPHSQTGKALRQMGGGGVKVRNGAKEHTHIRIYMTRGGSRRKKCGWRGHQLENRKKDTIGADDENKIKAR